METGSDVAEYGSDVAELEKHAEQPDAPKHADFSPELEKHAKQPDAPKHADFPPEQKHIRPVPKQEHTQSSNKSLPATHKINCNAYDILANIVISSASQTMATAFTSMIGVLDTNNTDAYIGHCLANLGEAISSKCEHPNIIISALGNSKHFRAWMQTPSTDS